MNTITFFVPGLPATQGSKTPMGRSKSGQIILVDSCKRLPVWRHTVAAYAQQAAQREGWEATQGAIGLSLEFVLPRPKLHYKGGKRSEELKEDAPYWHTVKPDLCKLTRAVEDALRGILYWDDSNVVLYANSQKRYCFHSPACPPFCQHVGVMVKTKRIPSCIG